MKRILFSLAVALSLALAFPAAAHAQQQDDAATAAKKAHPEGPEDLDLIDSGVVTEIVRSDLIKLNNGHSYKLDNIRVPVPYDQNAIDYLKKTVLNKKIGVFANRQAAESDTDRYGALLGHVLLDDGTWLQAHMVSDGICWAFSAPTDWVLVRPLYKYEEGARRRKAGFWADPQYSVKDDVSIMNTYNTFQVYEGTVRTVRVTNGNVFLNFGDDWKTDFTLVIKIEDRNNFLGDNAEGFFAPDLVKHRIRVRGWVENNNGPLVELTHPQQLETLDKIDK